MSILRLFRRRRPKDTRVQPDIPRLGWQPPGSTLKLGDLAPGEERGITICMYCGYQCVEWPGEEMPKHVCMARRN